MKSNFKIHMMCVIALFSSLIVAQGEDKEQFNKALVVHLKIDDYTTRVVDYWLDPRFYSGDFDMTMAKDDPYLIEGRWINQQGEKIFPVMLELFILEQNFRKKEYNSFFLQ